MSEYFLGDLQQRFKSALDDLTARRVIPRIWAKDHTVWHPDPDEIANRLGWLESPNDMMERHEEIRTFVDDVRNEGFTHALLLGMGGSSLAPEVFRNTFGVTEGFIDLSVLDSTDPGAVRQYEQALDPAKTLFIVSTKSGGTIETLSFFKYFYNLVKEQAGDEKAGRHFVAITDPGSSLCDLAKDLSFQKTFLNNPDIGGRYSVFSFFGLVPAALLGIDLAKLLDRAQKMAAECRQANLAANPGAMLGAALGQAALNRREKLTLQASKGIAHLGVWVEQLVAESTGKDGKGILPVDLEATGPVDVYGRDRFFVISNLGGEPGLKRDTAMFHEAGHPVVAIELNDIYDLGAEMFRWEFATAVASECLQINPFDQPDVESAKVQAKQMMDAYHETGKLPSPRASLESEALDIYGSVYVQDLDEALSIFFADANTGPGTSSARSYVAIQAYLQPTPEIETALQDLRHDIRKHLKLATTIGFGPRFLHSTGQLHKGDQGNGLFIQITSDVTEDLDIPDTPGSAESSISFDILKSAQALGDREALIAKGRKVIRFHLKGDILEGIHRLRSAIEDE